MKEMVFLYIEASKKIKVCGGENMILKEQKFLHKFIETFGG